jgi:hypothetical protein
MAQSAATSFCRRKRQKIAEALYKGIASYADTLSHSSQVAKRD